MALPRCRTPNQAPTRPILTEHFSRAELHKPLALSLLASPSMFVVRCWNCGDEWGTEGWEDVEECPICGAEVLVEEGQQEQLEPN